MNVSSFIGLNFKAIILALQCMSFMLIYVLNSHQKCSLEFVFELYKCEYILVWIVFKPCCKQYWNACQLIWLHSNIHNVYDVNVSVRCSCWPLECIIGQLTGSVVSYVYVYSM